MACFDDFITYHGSGITPTSGLYVDSLTGVILAKADAIADSDYATGVAFINDRINFAIEVVSNDLRTYALPYFKIHSVIGHHITAKFKSDYHTISANDRGFKIKKTSSPLSKIHVNRVTILGNTTGNHDLVITDGRVQTTIETVSLVAGVEKEVEVNYEANRDEILITIANIKPAKGTLKAGSCSTCGKNYNSFKVYGWTGDASAWMDSPSEGNISNNHFGIRADISIICSQNNLACLLKAQLGMAVLYRFGVEFFREVTETDRLNYFTLVSQDNAIEYEQKYMEEYTTVMKTLTRTLPYLLRKLDYQCISINQAKYLEVF